MYKKIPLLLLLFLQLLSSQDFSRDWNSHFSYNDIIDVDASETKIYAAANNSLFIHNIQENSNIEFSTINGLSSENIKIIKHVDGLELIILGFENGLVGIINERTGEITSLNDIPAASNFPADRIFINNLFVDNGILYIATGFGIVEYDLINKSFKNTYTISNSLSVVSNILSVGVLGDFIFASIEGRGTFIGNKKDRNLILASNWTSVEPTEFDQFNLFSGQIIARQNNSIFTYNGTNFTNGFTSTEEIKRLKVINNLLFLTKDNSYQELDSNLNTIKEITFNDNLRTKIGIAFSINGQTFFSQQENGLLRTTDLFTTPIQINPSGPLKNTFNDIEIRDGNLWAVHGRVINFSIQPNDANNGISRFQNQSWTSIPYTDFEIPYLVDIAIDPNDNEHVFFSSFFQGILEYRNNSFFKFDASNSNVEKGSFSLDFVDQIRFDNSQNLWFTNSFTENLVKRFSSTGTGEEINFSAVLDPNFDSLANFNGNAFIFDNQNNFYFGTFFSGLTFYNSRTKELKIFDDEELNDIPRNITALAFDVENQLWIGTRTGLRVLEDPSIAITEPSSNVKAEPIIFLDGEIPQELLRDTFITDIKVDPENNKWVSTFGAGVFKFSSDGQETLFQFTTSNSPLPSNNVAKIAIDDTNGNVFFATEKGLMEFKSNIIEAQENLDQLKIFPNPVRPEYGNITVRIEGLTAGANVKITDIEGNLVFEDQNSVINGTGSGVIEWDTKSFSGNKVASGVYLILITSEDQLQTKVGKLLIVR